MINITRTPETAKYIGLLPFRMAWQTAHNPIRFQIERRDYEIINIVAGPTPYELLVYVNGVIPILGGVTTLTDVNQYIYINNDVYKGKFLVSEYTQISPQTVLTIKDTFWIGNSVGGYILDHVNKKNHWIKILLTVFDWQTQQFKLYDTRRYTSDPEGNVKADISQMVQTLTYASTKQDYTLKTFFDKNSTAIYKIGVQELWTGGATDEVYYQPEYYANKSAFQIKSKYGSNMLDYVPINMDSILGEKKAKFISSFNQPVYFVGFPFDLGYIYSEHILQMNYTLEQECINVNGVSITNVQDQLARQIMPCEARVMMRSIGGYPAGTKYLDINLKANSIEQDDYYDSGYIDNGYYEVIPPNPSPITPFIMTETKRIEINIECAEQPIYLRWKGTGGGWDYWLFSKTQKDDLITKAGEDYEVYEDDIRLSEGSKELMSKTSTPELTVGANSINRTNLNGFKVLLESIKVQMLMNPLTWQTEGCVWQTVFIEGKIPNDTSAPVFDFECRIFMQERNLISQ